MSSGCTPQIAAARSGGHSAANVRNSGRPGDAVGEEGGIAQFFRQDDVSKRVEQWDVRAGPGRDVNRPRLARELGAPWIDHDELCPATAGLTNPGADHGVVFRGIRAGDQNRARKLDVVEAVRGGSGAQHGLQGRRARRVAHAGAAVDIVRADGDAREFLREVVLLVRSARRAEHAHRVGSVARDNPTQSIGSGRNGVRPRGVPPPAHVANSGARDAIAGGHEVERVSAFHAGMTVIGASLEGRARLDDPAVTRAVVQLAADAAVRADRARPGRGRPQSKNAAILQRPGRTRIDAGATRDTGTGEQRRSVGMHNGLRAAIPKVPDVLSLKVGTNAHAAIAVDAARHVGAEAGVTFINRFRRRRRRLRGQTGRAQVTVEFLLRRVCEGRRRIVAGEHLQHHSALGQDRLRPRPDLHAVDDGRGAGGDRLDGAGDLHQTEPACARWLQPWVIAQRRNLDSELPRRFEDCRAGAERGRQAIDSRTDRGHAGDGTRPVSCGRIRSR